MLENSTLNGTDEVLTAQPNAIENFVICDLPGFADFADQLPTEKQTVGKEGARWWGGMTYQQSVSALRYGDMAGVAGERQATCRNGITRAGLAVLAHSQFGGRHVSERAAVPGRQSVQHEAEAALYDCDRAVVDLRRAGRERRHRRQRRGSSAGRPCWRWCACWRTSDRSNCGA